MIAKNLLKLLFILLSVVGMGILSSQIGMASELPAMDAQFSTAKTISGNQTFISSPFGEHKTEIIGREIFEKEEEDEVHDAHKKNSCLASFIYLSSLKKWTSDPEISGLQHIRSALNAETTSRHILLEVFRI